MSVLPDILLHRTFISGLKSVRKDTRLIDYIFKNLNQVDLQAIKKFILETSIDFSINFPKKDLTLPSVVLIMKGEREAQTFLGDVMGDITHPFVPDQEVTIDTLGGLAASQSGSSGLPRKLLGDLPVASATESSLVFDEEAHDYIEELLEEELGGLDLYVVSGAGAGKVYSVERISPLSLDIDGVFSPYLDSTSVVDLRVPVENTVQISGEPSRVYQKEDRGLLKLGVNYEVSYQLHILASDPIQVIYLYGLIKAIFLSQRVYLESQGLMNLSIEGSDLAPRSEYLPVDAFQRVMTFQFTYPFAFMGRQEVFDSITTSILPEPGDRELEDVVIDLTI